MSAKGLKRVEKKRHEILERGAVVQKAISLNVKRLDQRRGADLEPKLEHLL